MQTNLASWVRDTEQGKEADEILRRCVHCGFCQATCPTYQILGDELDSPRGRIYLIKQVLEGQEPTRATQEHLDRCLTCRNCETTCPSGVEYGALIDIGRKIVDERVERPTEQKIKRAALRGLLNSPAFGPAMKAGRLVKGFLPDALKAKLPDVRPAGDVPAQAATHARQVIMLSGCVQPSMMPSIDAATRRVLHAVGIGTRVVTGSGCCGAINFHLDAQEAGLKQMRANIDAWLPLLESGAAEAVVMNASGCGGMVKEYAHHLRHDPVYGPKAQRLVAHVKDISELLAPLADTLRERIGPLPDSVAFHPPCTLQHWQGLRALNEKLLAQLGFALKPFNESHLCCGSAGTYSVTQPELSAKLRERKLGHIAQAQVSCIVSSNIGCIGHLQAGSSVPVRHWIEVVDEALIPGFRG